MVLEINIVLQLHKVLFCTGLQLKVELWKSF